MAELLAPAGNVEALDAAIGEGADAVYLGLKSFNARMRSSNFSWREFEGAVRSLHRMGRKIYVTVNTVAEEKETERLYRFLKYLNETGPDGLIVQDFGVVRMCQEFFPGLELHASTQMNVESADAANLLVRQGLKRVVLARELGLEELKAVKEHTKAELEVFVHGALCVSESGLCLFSSLLGGKSANRGECTQACRRLYTAESRGAEETGYYFSPCDLQLIDQIPDLMKIGIDSFKIEGRMKSAEYVGSVTAAYRYVMDHWEGDRKGSVAEGKRILSTDFARSKTSYWYGFKDVQEGVSQAGAKILNPKQAGGTGIYLGKLNMMRNATRQEHEEEAAASSKEIQIRMATIHGGSYDPDPGDSIRIHRKDDSGRVSHKVRLVKTDDKGRRWIDVPAGFQIGDEVYLLQTKSMSKRYKRVLPEDLSSFRRQPGADKLPILDLTPLPKGGLSYFPAGTYIAVSTTQDAHLVQTARPARIVVELNNETEYDFLHKDDRDRPIFPTGRKNLIISLDPFLPEGAMEHFRSVLAVLLEAGYVNFVVNNLAQLEMLKCKGCNLIAGPYLYTFNRWSASFLENQDIMAFQMPYENGEANLSRTFVSREERSRVLVPIFAYPVLFRMRFKLPESYDFTYFTDKQGIPFKVNSTPDGSFVMPELPFSIVEKSEQLRNAGFDRQLIDFTKTKVGKADIKNLVNYMSRREHIQNSSSFNWKDGFFDQEKMDAYKAADERKAREAMNEGRPYSGQKSAKAGQKSAKAGRQAARKPGDRKGGGRRR
ncbi:MAG: U32 family peptidase [Treponema sp.]|nr:U32 family peptidase [Treponema sp.]